MANLIFTLTIALFAFAFPAGINAQLTRPELNSLAPATGSSVPTRPASQFPYSFADTAAQPVVGAASNRSTNRYPYLFTRPADRQWIKSMPIHDRPNRTFHIYGNAVREGLIPHGPVGQIVFGK